MFESRDTNKNIVTHEPVKLLKKKSYPTYQLHAYINNSKIDNDTAFRIAILETLSWLRKRFRELDIPTEINLPEPDNFKYLIDKDLKSFRKEEGYILDVCYIPQNGIWAMHLSEPDLGPEPGNYETARGPVPGRIFETNIAYRIFNNKVECGFKTICSEPETSDAICEVFRPAVVKAIVRNKNLGLVNIVPIIEDFQKCEKVKDVDRLIRFIRNKERSQPVVIIAQKSFEEKAGDILNLHLENSKGHVLRNRLNAPKDYTDTLEKIDVGFDVRRLAKFKMSFAQFYEIDSLLLDNLNKGIDQEISVKPGEVRIIFPKKYKEKSINFNSKDIIDNTGRIVNEIEHILEQFPKGRDVSFGNIVFFNGARVEELQYAINLTKSKEDAIENLILKEEVLKDDFKEKISRYENLLSAKDKKVDRLKEIIDGLEDKMNETSGLIDDNRLLFLNLINEKENEIIRLQQKLSRPNKPNEIEKWVSDHFQGRLLLHSRAINELKKRNTNIDMNFLCDAIEYLSTEYYDYRFRFIDKEEHNRRCEINYGRRFEVDPTGSSCINMYKSDYTIEYGQRDKSFPKEVILDWHLKKGKGNEDSIRVYFYIDNDEKLIVIGYLPDHLPM